MTSCSSCSVCLWFAFPRIILLLQEHSESEDTISGGRRITSRLLTVQDIGSCGEGDQVLANTKRQPNAGIMLGQLYRRWTNIKTRFDQNWLCLIVCMRMKGVGQKLNKNIFFLYPIFKIKLTYRQSPANTRHPTNVGTMLAHRLRRWANIVPTLDKRLGGLSGVIWYRQGY